MGTVIIDVPKGTQKWAAVRTAKKPQIVDSSSSLRALLDRTSKAGNPRVAIMRIPKSGVNYIY